MAYAELWQPIDNAVQNVNQTINTISDRADRRQAQGLQSLMAMDSLQGKQLERTLAKNASMRAERQQRLQEENMDFDQKMRTAQEARQAALYKAGIPQRKLAQVQAQEALKPRAVPITTFFSTPEDIDMAVKSGIATQLARVIGGPGATFNQDSLEFVNASGEPLQLNLPQIKAVAPAAAGLIAASVDPRQMDEKKATQLSGEIKNLEDQYNKIAKNPKLPGAMIKELDYKIAKRKEELDSIKNKKPWDRIKEYEAKQRRLIQTGAWLEAIGKPVSMIKSAADANAEILDGLYEAKEDWLTGGKSGGGVFKELAVQRDAQGNIIGAQYVHIPKNLRGGMTPANVTAQSNNPLDETWSWADSDKFRHDATELKGNWLGFYNSGSLRFGKKDTQGQVWITPTLVDQEARFRNLFTTKADTGNYTPLKAMNESLNEVFSDEKEYWMKQSEIANELETGEVTVIDPKTKKERTVNLNEIDPKIAKQIRERKEKQLQKNAESFYTQAGYIPSEAGFKDLQTVMKKIVNPMP